MTRRRNAIAEAFIAHRLEMQISPAWRHLPDKARRLLDRLEVEHMEHGGAENGKLRCTYSNWQEAGLKRRNDIALAIRQCAALGFLDVTRQGWCSVSEFRTPSLYRLTYVFGRKDKRTGAAGNPTDEWRRIKSDDDATTALAKASAHVQQDTEQAHRKRRSLAENIDSSNARDTRTVVSPALPIARSL